MKNYDIHIVFGRVSRCLIDSNEIDPGTSKIISIYDDLSVGPLCDIGEEENVLRRKKWFQNVYGDISYFSEISDFIDSDLDSIESLIENSNEIGKVFLWTGSYVSEMVSTARLISHLLKLDRDILIVDYPNIAVKSVLGETVFPRSLVETAPSQVKEVLQHFRRIDEKELLAWKDLWKKQKLENGELRVLEQQKQVSVKGTDYFDSLLLRNCTEDFQKAARVIGCTLVDIDFAVNDDYLNWRLKQLASEGRIEAEGELQEIRDYGVRNLLEA
ncbi:DUF1835 domain-containing protein [Puteibacter caeruleilacunae]|nr:DUF1835 domain-containing protein [Puteibacter caeruleilacunae]